MAGVRYDKADADKTAPLMDVTQQFVGCREYFKYIATRIIGDKYWPNETMQEEGTICKQFLL